MMSIDMIQKGMSEQEVNKELASKFKSTMAVVELSNSTRSRLSCTPARRATVLQALSIHVAIF